MDKEHEEKIKQKYLVDNIIEGNYDPILFAKFLKQEKDNGDDINNWTIEELEFMVQLYQKEYDNHYNPNSQKAITRHIKELDLSTEDEFYDKLKVIEKKNSNFRCEDEPLKLHISTYI